MIGLYPSGFIRVNRSLSTTDAYAALRQGAAMVADLVQKPTTLREVQVINYCASFKCVPIKED
eukprot:2316538-Rhodomonas_salina.1